MTICTNPTCRTEMRCVKTGKLAVFGESHVYRGDEFQCPSCGARVLVTAGQPTHEPDVLDSHRESDLVLMDLARRTTARELIPIDRNLLECAVSLLDEAGCSWMPTFKQLKLALKQTPLNDHIRP